MTSRSEVSASPSFQGATQALLRRTMIRRRWSQYRAMQLHREYEARREMYERVAREKGLTYSENATRAAVVARLAARRCTPTPRKDGEIHTLAFVPGIGWHRHLLPDLRELGPVTLFDYVTEGYRVESFLRRDRDGLRRRVEMNGRFVAAARRIQAQQPIDWIFVYASGLEISASTIEQLTENPGVPLVNMCLDDKQSWTGPHMGDHRAGQVDIAAEFDLSWTSARVACEWYLAIGARPIYLPEGFDAAGFQPSRRTRDLPVSFVGTAYGYRPDVIADLRRRGVNVHAFGPGWPGGGYAKAPDIFNRSDINLGMGGIGYSEMLTNVKTRDFEVPGTGGGVYLTTYNADLVEHLTPGRDILCYRSRDEMLELIRYYLRHEDESRTIAASGRERCLREHRWRHRYEHLCRLLGILDGPGREAPVPAGNRS